jgi:LysM repeat protein
MKRILSATLLFLCMLLPSGASAATDEPTEYVVTKGDTMWGLSERFFKDPYYWPNLWAGNPSVTNPHFIYPGQKLKFYKDRVEVVPTAPVAGQESSPSGPLDGESSSTVPPERTVKERIFKVGAGETFLDGANIRKAGEIVATFENRVMVGEGDYVYTDIGSTRGGKVGQVYSVVKDAGPVTHPVQNYIVGHRYLQLGTVQLVEVTAPSSRAQVLRSFLEITRDSVLVPYRPARREIPLKRATRELKGYIVGTRMTNSLIGEGEIIFLDLGKKQGVEIGNLLYAVREVKPDALELYARSIPLPLRVLGAIVVIDAGETTSTALVVKSATGIYPGDMVMSTPDK